MSETRRLLEAAAALSNLLRASNIPHAFYGSVLTAVLSNAQHANEIFCIVEFDFTTTNSPWTNRLHTTYRRLIPAVDIEILAAGESGPRRLDSTTVMKIQGVPFLTASEFIRAKLKSWIIRGSEGDAHDISYVLSRYWNRVDINRIPEQDMGVFVSRNPMAAPAWMAIKRKYGM
ncbi:hypothetical protein LshimejAT787_0602560 [Lyophyllum shimeji]|uniref:Uncharacterized protein n=1 Tax=Lyophyllum shimeji TaxID=47721 RepID=A0A9P3PPA8_LYOSH|nr:hypothetical protein LshimejAT787_0602560 [Lyophyllum shimeji]